MKEKKLVSVGIPVFNEKKHIAEILNSIKTQSYPFLDIIVSDNASNDGTWGIIQEFSQSDSRFRIFKQDDNKGAAFNFKFVLDQARGEYFIWAGAHDKWDQNLIEECIEEMQKKPGLVLCFPQTRWIDNEGKIINNDYEAVNTGSCLSPASRILTFFKQTNRCNAIYGLHERNILLSTLPWPDTVGSDFFILMKIAEYGNICSVKKTSWYRRVVRQESRDEMIERQIKVLGITGLARKFPYLVQRIYILKELIFIKGSLTEKVKLIIYALWRFFLKPQQFKILLNEILRAAF